MRKILITGGAGFIGSHLADLLLENGFQVRLFDNLEPQVHGQTDRPTYLSPKIEFVRGNILDRSNLYVSLEGVEAIFHFAAMVGVGQSQYQIKHYTETNVLGTALLLDILANERHTVRKLLVASSMSVYGEGLYRRPSDNHSIVPHPRSQEQLSVKDFEMRDPETREVLGPLPTPEGKPLDCESIYALNKRDQEEYCLLFGRHYGIPVTACRLFNTYGSRQSLSNPYTGVAAIFMSQIKNGTAPLVNEDGLQSRDFVDVRDVARGFLLLLKDHRADGRVFNIGTGHRTTILELAKMLIDLQGKRMSPEITGRYRKGDIRHCYADISRVQALGFQPVISLTEGLRDLYQWVEKTKAIDQTRMAQEELMKRGLIHGK